MWMQAGSFIRILSIFSVLLIHASSYYENLLFKKGIWFISINDYNYFGAVFFNQLSRFSVPVFFILSGFGLSMKYKKDGFLISLESAGRFYIKRLYRVMLPFLFWTIVVFFALYFSNWLAEWNKGPSHGMGYLAHLFLVRGADYHFYFLIIIIQLYLFFPLLFSFAEKYKKWSFVLMILLFIIHIIYASPSYYILKNLGYERKIFSATFSIYWVFYFYFGIYFSLNIESILKRVNTLSKWFWILLTIVLLSGVLIEYVYYFQEGVEPNNYNHFQRITVTFYSLAVWLTFFRVLPQDSNDGYYLKIFKNSNIQFLAGISFHVYLFHTIYLRLVEKLLITNGLYFCTLSFTLTMFLSILSGYLFLVVIQKIEWGRKFFAGILGF